MWAVLAAPRMAGNDIAKMTDATKAIQFFAGVASHGVALVTVKP